MSHTHISVIFLSPHKRDGREVILIAGGEGGGGANSDDSKEIVAVFAVLVLWVEPACMYAVGGGHTGAER